MNSLTPIADQLRLEAERASQVKADRLEAAKRLTTARKRLEKEGPAANAAMAAAHARVVAIREKFVKENEEARQAASIAEGAVMQMRADVDREEAFLRQTSPSEIGEIAQRIHRLSQEIRAYYTRPDYEAKLTLLRKAEADVNGLAALADGDKAIASAREIYGAIPADIRVLIEDGPHRAYSALARAS